MGENSKERYWRNDFRRRDVPPEVETTFFVSNIPEKVSRTMLWRAFQPHGDVTDAFIPKKKDVKGNIFGFIRYANVGSVTETLKQMNTVMIWERQLRVVLAKFDRNRKEFEKGGANDAGPSNTKYRQREYIQQYPENRKTAWQHAPGEFPPLSSDLVSTKRLLVKGNGALFPNHCLRRSVVVTARDLRWLHRAKIVVASAGFSEAAVSYIGGLKILIVFRDREEALKFLEEDKTVWDEAFENGELWSGQHIQTDRICELRVVGVPCWISECEKTETNKKYWDDFLGFFTNTNLNTITCKEKLILLNDKT